MTFSPNCDFISHSVFICRNLQLYISKLWHSKFATSPNFGFYFSQLWLYISPCDYRILKIILHIAICLYISKWMLFLKLQLYISVSQNLLLPTIVPLYLTMWLYLTFLRFIFGVSAFISIVEVEIEREGDRIRKVDELGLELGTTKRNSTKCRHTAQRS